MVDLQLDEAMTSNISRETEWKDHKTKKKFAETHNLKWTKRMASISVMNGYERQRYR